MVDDFHITKKILNDYIKEYIKLFSEEAIEHINKHSKDTKNMFEKEYKIQQLTENLKLLKQMNKIGNAMKKIYTKN